VLLDTDIAWPNKIVKEAIKRGVLLIGSSPCIEGYLLKLLGHPVPVESRVCKSKLDEFGFGPTVIPPFLGAFKSRGHAAFVRCCFGV
jgi:hypothetical protein